MKVLFLLLFSIVLAFGDRLPVVGGRLYQVDFYRVNFDKIVNSDKAVMDCRRDKAGWKRDEKTGEYFKEHRGLTVVMNPVVYQKFRSFAPGLMYRYAAKAFYRKVNGEDRKYVKLHRFIGLHR